MVPYRFKHSFTILAIFTMLNFAKSQPLSFTPEGKFTIFQMTDLHYDGGDATDLNNMKIQDKLIKRIKPDMVAATGDVVSGEVWGGREGFIESLWEKFTSPLISNKVPYAYAVGNHDIAGDLDQAGLFLLETMNNYSLSAKASNDSYDYFNYYIPVYSGIEEGKVAALIWVFDTWSAGCVGNSNSWGCVKPQQVEWYKKKSQELKNLYGDVHSIAFLHIPLPEYVNLYNDFEFYGRRGENSCCPLVNTNLFSELKKGGTTAVFAGHDHYNDYGGEIDGVELAYGRKTGYGGYMDGSGGFQRGARVIELKESRDKNGTINVERETYVVVENPEQDNGQEENLKVQKQLRVRSEGKQNFCQGLDGEANGAYIERVSIAGLVIFLGIVLLRF